jgi:hypothetical protein
LVDPRREIAVGAILVRCALALVDLAIADWRFAGAAMAVPLADSLVQLTPLFEPMALNHRRANAYAPPRDAGAAGSTKHRRSGSRLLAAGDKHSE